MTVDDMVLIESHLDLIRHYIKECRKKHRKISVSRLKSHAADLYNSVVQAERFEKGLGPGRAGMDYLMT